MLVIHHETFRVRYSECDAYGHLNNINYLRWMQEAVFGASAAVGYDWARYNEIGYMWLMRETDIEYLTPVEYGDEVELKTWVIEFQRFRSRWVYEFTATQTGQLATRALTDLVYVNSETLQPAVVPEEMQLAFLPEGVPEEGILRESFPVPPSPPPNVFSICRQVEWRDIDMMWQLNNAVYLAYIEDVGTHVCEAHGWSIQRMMEEGFMLIVRRHRIKFRQPAKMGDELEIATWYSDAQRTNAVRHYTIRRVEDGELLVQARTRWVWINVKTGRPIRIPEYFLKDFADNLAVD
jgi:acyl-CoA thioester hydrolase